MKILSTLPVKNDQRAEVEQIQPGADYVQIGNFKERDEEAEILVAFGKPLRADELENYPNLRWIQMMSAGVDNLPLTELAKRDIILTNARGAHQIQMTEHIMWSLLTLFRQAHIYIRQQEKKVWDSGVKLDEMYGKTVCIVGAGRIGEAVAEKCRDFGMTAVGISKSGTNHPAYDRVGNLSELDAFLAMSDAVVVLLPLTPETERFFNAQRFAAMKHGSYFINVARGPVVDEEALAEALTGGQVGAAALDVFVKEPLSEDSPFWLMPNVVLTPHIGGRSPHYSRRTFEIFLKNLRAYPEREQMINVIDLARGY